MSALLQQAPLEMESPTSQTFSGPESSHGIGIGTGTGIGMCLNLFSFEILSILISDYENYLCIMGAAALFLQQVTGARTKSCRVR